MTRVSVFLESSFDEAMTYRAVAGRDQATGRTAGEALDALASRLSPREADTFVIVRSLSPDRFFSVEQRRRIEELIAARREASLGQAAWSAEQQNELERLVDAELLASAERADELARELAR
jgi:hypothetical protein